MRTTMYLIVWYYYDAIIFRTLCYIYIIDLQDMWLLLLFEVHFLHTNIQLKTYMNNNKITNLRTRYDDVVLLTHIYNFYTYTNK